MLARAFGIFAFDRKSCVPLTPARHVLVIRWDGKIGDAIVSSVLYREIRKSTVIKVTVITTEDLAELHQCHFGADQVLVSQSNPGLRELFKLQRVLSNVDTVIHPVGRIRASELFFLWCLQPRNVFSLDDELGWVNVKMRKQTARLTFAQKYAFIVRTLGVKEIDENFIIPVLDAPEKATHTFPCCEIVFNPFASRPDKSIGMAKAVEVLRLAADCQPKKRIGILNSPATKDLADALAHAVARSNVHAIDGVKTFYDAVAVVNGASVVISVDTAIVHIASGLKKKLVAICPRLDGEFNAWLPVASDQTHVIDCPQDSAHYRQTGVKNMNSFDNTALLNAVNILAAAAGTKEHDLVIHARIIPGLGVAIRNLRLQLPLIEKEFPEIASCHRGTINLELERPLDNLQPDYRTRPIHWVPGSHNTEVFDFVRIALELPDHGELIPAWLYVAHRSPHRRNPRIHEVITRQLDLTGVTQCRIHLRQVAIDSMSASKDAMPA